MTGGLIETDIRPFAPAFALETLAVKLREARDGKDGFLQDEDPGDILWKRALGALYRSEEWKKKVEGVLNGLHVTVMSAGKNTNGTAEQRSERTGETVGWRDSDFGHHAPVSGCGHYPRRKDVRRKHDAGFPSETALSADGY